MNLLNAKLYDPAVAVAKITTAAMAMTAFDTANLRLAVTVPAHGMVRFRLLCAISGDNTYPQVLLGVMNGATIIGRVTPRGSLAGTALATTRLFLAAEFTVTGLSPGAANFDAAYGVEVANVSTAIRYGGPDNAVANDAWGGFVFEAWDPAPAVTVDPAAIRAAIGMAAANMDTQLGAQLTAANAIKTQTDKLAFTVPNRLDANIRSVNSVAINGTGGAGDPWGP